MHTVHCLTLHPRPHAAHSKLKLSTLYNAFYTVAHNISSSKEECRVRKAVSREWVGSECELTVSGGHSTDRSHHHQSTYTTRHRFYFGNQFHLGTSLPSSTGGIGGDYAQVPGGYLKLSVGDWLGHHWQLHGVQNIHYTIPDVTSGWRSILHTLRGRSGRVTDAENQNGTENPVYCLQQICDSSFRFRDITIRIFCDHEE